MNKKLIKIIAGVTCGLGIAATIPTIVSSCGEPKSPTSIKINIDGDATKHIVIKCDEKGECKDLSIKVDEKYESSNKSNLDYTWKMFDAQTGQQLDSNKVWINPNTNHVTWNSLSKDDKLPSQIKFKAVSNADESINDEITLSFDYALPDSVYEINNTSLIGFKSDFHPDEYSSCTVMSLPETICSVADKAFYDDKTYQSTIPTNIKYFRALTLNSIGAQSFRNARLVSFNIEQCDSLFQIGEYAFYKSDITQGFDFSKYTSLERIGKFAFEYCQYLKTIDLSNASNLTEIMTEAFANCNQLESIILLQNLSNIGSNAFTLCPNIKQIDFPNGSDYYVKAANINSNNQELGCAVISKDKTGAQDFINSTTIVGGLAYGELIFDDNQNLDMICDSAFTSCASIKKIDLSKCSKLTKINANAFSDCLNLSTISLPKSLTTIDTYAFANCPKISNIELKGNSTFSIVNIGPSGYAVTSGTTWDNNSVAAGSLAYGELDFTNLSSVTEIAAKAFTGCDAITSIKLSKNISIISDQAFYECNFINEIEIPNENSVYGIATNLGDISKGQVIVEKKSGDSLWSNENHVVGNLAAGEIDFTKVSGLTSIEKENAFAGCSSIASIILPKELSSIGHWAFFECSQLSKITWNGLENDPSVNLKSNEPFLGISNVGEVICTNTSSGYNSQKLLDWLNKNHYGFFNSWKAA